MTLLAGQEVVGRWAAQQEKELKLLARPDGSRLFSNLTRGNHYLVQAEGYLNNSGSGQTSEMALIWNRTLPGGSVSASPVQLQNYLHLVKKITCTHFLYDFFLDHETKAWCLLGAIFLLGDFLPVFGAIPLRFLLRVHVLSGMSVWPVLWLVSIFVPLSAAWQPGPWTLPWGGEQRREGRRSAPSAVGTPALHFVWRVQRLLCMHSGMTQIPGKKRHWLSVSCSKCVA